MAAKKMPPPGWTKPDQNVGPVLDLSKMGRGIGGIHSVGLPVHIYPLYENGFRAHRRQSIQDNIEESAKLYANFAKVAAENTLAWNYGESAATVESIGTVSKKNRMICFPCTVISNLWTMIIEG
jgi:hypothetical protein